MYFYLIKDNAKLFESVQLCIFHSLEVVNVATLF